MLSSYYQPLSLILLTFIIVGVPFLILQLVIKVCKQYDKIEYDATIAETKHQPQAEKSQLTNNNQR